MTNIFTHRLFLFAAAAVCSLIFLPQASAQRRGIPSDAHYVGCRMIEQGQIATAQKLFQEELTSAMRVGPVRWIDSICYYVMYGETLYLTGDFRGALAAYESAIDLYMENAQWLARVSYATGLTSAPRRPTPWGVGRREIAAVAVFPKNATISTGDPITEERLRQGGLMASPELRSIDPLEVIRCTAVAIRRRTEILGPLTSYDPRSRQMLESFSTRAVTPNHWSVTWLDVLFGLSLQAAGKVDEAQNILSKSLLMTGQYDHHLTSCALLALGDLYLLDGKSQEAADCFFEASVASFQFEYYEEAAEGIEKYAAASRAVRRTADLEPLGPALAWATGSRSVPILRLTILLEAAENALSIGRLGDAQSCLDASESLLRGLHLTESRWADRWNFTASQLAFAQGDVEKGDAVLSGMISGAAPRSVRQFQIQTLNQLVRDGNGWNLTPRNLTDIYAEVLRVCDHIDWSAFPIESMVFETLTPPEMYENWFLTLLERDQKEAAFEVAEITRTTRYFTACEYGGRLFSLRFLFESPPAGLAEDLRVMRQNLLTEFPDYDTLSRDAADVKAKISALPIVPANDEQNAQREKLLGLLSDISAKQELTLRRIASGRIYVPTLFPPFYSTADLQKMLPDDATLLTFFEAHGEIFGFMLTRSEIDVWKVGSSDAVADRVSGFLKSLGCSDGSKPKQLRDIQSAIWQKTGRKLLADMLGDPTSGAPRFNVAFKRLAIVPDGPLWYLPFEALCLPSGDDLVPLIASPDVTVEYAPTAATAFAEGRTRKNAPLSETAVLPGVLFPREKRDVQNAAIERIESAAKRPVRIDSLKTDFPAAALAFRIHRLVTLDEIVGSVQDWSPLYFGKIFDDDAIRFWKTLPWGAPEWILLPGYRSAAEDALKRDENGEEFFFPLLTLEARGTETVLISRWRTGGRSAYDLMTAWIRLSAEETSASAWKKTVESFRAQPMRLDEEPRFRGSVDEKEIPNGEHPFFWAGYMLVARGFETAIPAEENPADKNSAEGEPQKETDAFEELAPNGDSEKISPDPQPNQQPDPQPLTDKKSAAEPSESSKPITDDELEEADRQADDFYAPNRSR